MVFAVPYAPAYGAICFERNKNSGISKGSLRKVPLLSFPWVYTPHAMYCTWTDHRRLSALVPYPAIELCAGGWGENMRSQRLNFIFTSQSRVRRKTSGSSPSRPKPCWH